MPCHPALPAIIPPITGAQTGATPFIAPVTASITASSLPEYMSEATERAMTMPPAPAMPCTRRNAMNCIILWLRMHPAVATRNSAIAITSGFFLPNRSLRGPKMSCPTARPIMLAVSPS